jgi:hypothetical protein
VQEEEFEDSEEELSTKKYDGEDNQLRNSQGLLSGKMHHRP